jgi:hypothetical protein
MQSLIHNRIDKILLNRDKEGQLVLTTEQVWIRISELSAICGCKRCQGQEYPFQYSDEPRKATDLVEDVIQ